jgi:hypothetical protein
MIGNFTAGMITSIAPGVDILGGVHAGCVRVQAGRRQPA